MSRRCSDAIAVGNSHALVHDANLSEVNFGLVMRKLKADLPGVVLPHSLNSARTAAAAVRHDFQYEDDTVSFARNGLVAVEKAEVRRVNFTLLADPLRAVVAMANLAVQRGALTREAVRLRGVRIGLAGDTGDDKCRIMLMISDVARPGSPLNSIPFAIFDGKEEEELFEAVRLREMLRALECLEYVPIDGVGHARVENICAATSTSCSSSPATVTRRPTANAATASRTA